MLKLKVFDFYFSLLLISLLFYFSYILLGTNGTINKVRILEAKIEEQSFLIKHLKKKNNQAYQQILWLKKYPTAVEESARYDLGFVKPYETYYQVVESV